jgi:hypothetical protein
MANERFLNKNHQPSESEILTALGSSEELWIWDDKSSQKLHNL